MTNQLRIVLAQTNFLVGAIENNAELIIQKSLIARDELKADILQERRKEFAFEGMRFFDLTRLNLPIPSHTISQFPTVLLPIDANENRRVNAITQ